MQPRLHDFVGAMSDFQLLPSLRMVLLLAFDLLLQLGLACRQE